MEWFCGVQVVSTTYNIDGNTLFESCKKDVDIVEWNVEKSSFINWLKQHYDFFLVFTKPSGHEGLMSDYILSEIGFVVSYLSSQAKKYGVSFVYSTLHYNENQYVHFIGFERHFTRIDDIKYESVTILGE